MANIQFKLVPVDYSKPYDEQPECKRHVIGAYANLARHNMTVTINVIMQAIGMELFNENDIDDAFNKKHRKKLLQLDNIQKVNLQKRLYRHFPFFKRMKLEDETKKSVQLNTLLEVMSDFTNCMAILRNFYTHYHPYNTPEEEKRQLDLRKAMGKRLQYLYENTSQMFKSNESLDHESNEVFAALRMPVDNIEEIKEGDKDYKKLFNLINDPKTSHDKKRGLSLNRETGIITRKSIKFIRNPEYQAYMIDDENGMSDIAIIYFLCLFLEKKVSFELMEEVGLTEQIKFEGEHADKQLLYLKEIMCMNRIRMTKTKLDSEMTDTALALDMINELRKCPKPLYDVFCKEARDEFKDDSTVLWEKAHDKEAVETEDNKEESDESSPIEKDTPRSTFVRWEDRFPQMALRYIDYQGLFNEIRFQLNLGKYRFAFYNHDSGHSIDGEERLRILQKELHGFGRIQEVEAKKNEKWASLYDEKQVEDGLTKKKPDQAGQAPYVTEQKAQYAIDEKSHSIGLRWEGWDNKCLNSGNAEWMKQHFGDKEEEGLDKNKMFIPYLPTRQAQGDNKTYQGEPLLPPQAMLSLYELPGLLFYQYLLKKYGRDIYLAEQAIKDCATHLKDFFTDISEGTLPPQNMEEGTDAKEDLCKLLHEKYDLRLSDIPEKLRKYLLNVSIDYDEKLNDSASNRLEGRKERIERTLESYRDKKKRIGSEKNKFDKMRATIKAGSLAQALIRDIMDWLPLDCEGRKKLTGQSYIVLQTAMAMLGQEYENEAGERKTLTLANLKEMMVKAKIVDETVKKDNSQKFHPFLHLVLQDCTVVESVEFLYELYLEKELRYIQNTINKLSKSNFNYRYMPFLHHERDRWKAPDAQAMQKLAKGYIEKPLQLPDGLFTRKIFKLLQSVEVENKDFQAALTQTDAEEPANRLSNNTSYLINLYLNLVEKDHSQPFYLTEPIDESPSPYRHIYRIFKKLYGQRIGRNQTTTPAYTISELREKRKQAYVDVNKYTYKIVQEWKDKQMWNYKKEQRKYLGEENKRREKRNATLLTKDEINKEVERRTNDYLLRLEKKPKKQLQKVYDNERTIRRFKTQDILLLIMAREILKAKNSDRDFAKDFCLKYVMSDSLLDKPIDFEWRVNIERKKKNAEGEVEKDFFSKTIRQDGMKMKNYGQFYKFASDHQRLESLLSRLPQNIFQRAEIENEFFYYDINRSDVFRQVYIIESKAYMLNPDLEEDSNAEKEWFFYTDKKGKKHPKRNNFMSLLEILAAGKDGILSEKEKNDMQSIRNAFGHNTYDVDLPVVFEGRENHMKIPEVANGIKDKVQEQTEELKKKLNK